MDNQPQQRFCTNCGQPMTPGVAFCTVCGMQVSAAPTSAPGQVFAGAQPDYSPPYAQVPPQAQDDQFLADLGAAYLVSQQQAAPQQRGRRPRSMLQGCGCLLLVLVVLAGPFVGLALTHGRTQQIFGYVAGGMVVLFLLLVLIGMLATRRGREVLADGCLDALLGGLLGGG